MDKKKIVHQLDTPFSATSWPQVSQEDQDTILELLCKLLAPLGQHRKAYVTRSKGKRSKALKRKRKDVSQETQASARPPAPELSRYVDVGLTRITNTLEKSSSNADAPAGEADNPVTPSSRLYSVVFVARSSQPSAFNSHFPQMVAVASKSQQVEEPIRLVGFSKACEERLSACLGIPRASSIGLRADAPLSKALVDFVRAHVPPVEALWLDEASDAVFRETKIKAIPTTVGPKRQKKNQ